MNRRHFLAGGSVGLAAGLLGSRKIRAASPQIDAAANETITRLASTTLTPQLLDLETQFADPVMIDTITVTRHDGMIWAFVRSTDGVSGAAIGNARHNNLLSILEGLILPYFVGKDARQIESLLDKVYVHKSQYKYAGMPFFNCVALLELAIFDLLARTLEVPVHRLLGKLVRDRFPVYLSRFPRDNQPEAEAEDLLATMESTGAQAVKVKIGARMSNNRDGYEGRTAQLIPHLRKVLPEGTAIYVDANGSYDVPTAIEVGHLLQDNGVGFFEEPCPWQEIEATKAVADALEMAVAGGEQDSSLPQFAWMIRNGALDIIQPDLLYNGGLVRSLRVAQMAEAAGLPVVPHSPGGHLNPYLLHYAAVVPNLGPHLEQQAGRHIRDGVIALRDEPGWGFDPEPHGEQLLHVSRNGAAAGGAGNAATVASTLAARRDQIREQFQSSIYGRVPNGLTTKFAWAPTNEPNAEVTAETGTLTVTGKDDAARDIGVRFYRPAATQDRVPAIVFINHRAPSELDVREEAEFLPVLFLVRAGWAVAAFNVADVTSDKTSGGASLHDLTGTAPGPDRAGAVMQWAWTASRIAGALASRPDIDAGHIAVAGHSRSGKAALLAGALDPRFAWTFANNSGCGGAAHTRTKRGEGVAEITTNFPHWFADTFRDYAGREAELPVDQHQLLGVIAPRRVYIASASEDAWADPEAEFRSCQLASPLHELYGATGLIGPKAHEFPAPGEHLHGGSIGYHLRPGKHDLTAEDWRQFLAFTATAPPARVDA